MGDEHEEVEADQNIEIPKLDLDKNGSITSSLEPVVESTVEKSPPEDNPDGGGGIETQISIVDEELTPRSKKRKEAKAARKKAKAAREAARREQREKRKKQQEELKKLSGKERDEARRKIAADADAAREEQAKERQADFAIQDAAKEEKKVDKATLEYLKKKEIEREIAEQKRKEEAERLARITTAVRDGDRFHSRCQISIKKIGTFAYGTWHKRFVSLGYREFRLYKKKNTLTLV